MKNNTFLKRKTYVGWIISVLLICGSISLKAQTTEKEQIQLFRDTLNFEYEGSIQEHERIIKRVLPKVTSNVGAAYVMIDYPLIGSYHKRITSLTEDYLQKNAKITKMQWFGVIYDRYEYELPNCLYSFTDGIRGTASDNIAEYYLEVLAHWSNLQLREALEKSFSIEKDLEDDNFKNLVSKATQDGVKATATIDGFYNKQLARKLARGILYNKLNMLMTSSQKSLAYRIIYIADTYSALGYLSDDNNYDKTLNKMLNKNGYY